MNKADNDRNTGQAEVFSQPIRGAETEELEIDLFRLFFHLLERAKWIAAAAILGAVVMGLVTQFLITPMYSATAKLYVLSAHDAAINLSDFQIGTYLTADYQEAFRNWHVHERVIRELNLPYSYADMADMLEVTNPSGTRILYITVTSAYPEEAKRIADAYAAVAQEFIADTMDTKKPNLFEEALLPSSPSSPFLFQNAAIAFFVCAVLACGAFTAEFLLDDKIRTSDDLEKYFGIPTIGLLPLQDERPVPVGKSDRKRRRESA